MYFGETVEKIIYLIVFCGFAAFSIGLIFWSFKMMQKYSISWEVGLTFMGLTLIMIACVGAKLFSRD